MASDDKFRFVEQNSVECWCDFGATLYATILTIFTISNGTLKTPRDNFDQRSKLAKKVLLCRAFFCYLLDELRGNEIRLRREPNISLLSAVLFTFEQKYGIIQLIR